MAFAADTTERTQLLAPKDRAGQLRWLVPGRITPGFNLALLAFHAALGFFHFVVSSEKAKGVALEGLVLSSALDLGRFAVVLLMTAYFVEGFWARLISSVFAIRPISYQEAIAIVLMIGILFGI